MASQNALRIYFCLCNECYSWNIVFRVILQKKKDDELENRERVDAVNDVAEMMLAKAMQPVMRG